MDIALVHEVDVEALTPERRVEIAELLRKVLMGEGSKLTRMQERAGSGSFTLLLEFERDPNPRNLVTYKPLGARGPL